MESSIIHTYNGSVHKVTENNYNLTPTVNECFTDNGGCEEVCTDTLTGYVCGCNEGYQLTEDGHTCEGSFLYAFSNKKRHVANIKNML